MSSRRKPRVHWLVGGESQSITGCELPSGRQVLRFFLFKHRTVRLTVRASAAAVATSVVEYWDKAGIPTRLRKHIIASVERLFADWMKLKKSKSREASPTFHIHKNAFSEQLDGLFDVAHHGVEETPLLRRLRCGKTRRYGKMWCKSRSCQLRRRRAIAAGRRKGQLQLLLRRREAEEKSQRTDRFATISVSPLMSPESSPVKVPQSTAPSSSLPSAWSLPSTSWAPDQDPDFVVKQENGAAASRTPRKEVNKAYLDMLDRTKTTVRAGAALFLTSQGTSDPEAVVMSKSTLHRRRVENRKTADGEEFKAEIRAMGKVTVHWDGKTLSDLVQGTVNVERLPIILSSGKSDKIIDCPKTTGTGADEARLVGSALQRYGAVDQVIAMGFDTPTTNTGPYKGCCLLLERDWLRKKVLWLACNHHVYEVMACDVFHMLLGPNKGPTHPMIERFRSCWAGLDHADYQPLDDDQVVIPSEELESIITFCQSQLENQQPRGDYRKLLNLSLAFLGVQPFNFKVLGAVSDARFMGKCNLSITTYMFRGQFHLSKSQEDGLLRLCLFVVRVYIRYWFTCQVPAWAPSNTLQLVQTLLSYGDEKISLTARNAIGRHLWYLSEINVMMALFDERLPGEEKAAMVKAALVNPGSGWPAPRVGLSTKLTITDVGRRQLSDFVTTASLGFFDITGIRRDFLATDVDRWPEQQSFIEGKAIVRDLHIVNDCAERGVALIKDYTNNPLTKDEEQLQFLLKLVKKHREMLPTLNNKSEILKL